MKDDFRLVTARNCFLYGEPDEQGGRTIEDEIFSGWAVRILEEGPQGFLKAETHYGYQGYVREECLRRTDREELLGRQDHKRFFRIGSPAADVMSVPEVEGVLLETLLKNSFVELLDADPDTLWSRIRTAKGTEGYVHSVFLRERLEDDGYLLQEDPYLPFTERCGERLAGLCVSEEEFRQQILRTAKEYLGTQYRWGGKSSAGLDCSGLVFMSYLENGILVYRDAHLVEGYPIREIPREKLKPADLIFFPGHVAMYLGGDRYIHSTGYKGTAGVAVNSLNLHDPDYRDDLADQITFCGTVFPEKAASAEEEKVQAGGGKTPESGSQGDGRFGWIRERLMKLPGCISFVFRDLATGETFCYQEKERHDAASLIKLYLMQAFYEGFARGDFDPEERIPVKREDCVPSCGVLTYLEDGKEVSLKDLITLSVIVSDNTAANLLIDRYGEEAFRSWLGEREEYAGTVFGRKMFDHAKAARGLDNYTTAEDTALLLEKIWKGTLVSREASGEMLRILRSQRLNGKIPFYLHTLRPRPEIAHKTGENDGVTHDAAIIEGEHPLLLVFLGSRTDAPLYEQEMAALSLEIYRRKYEGEL